MEAFVHEICNLGLYSNCVRAGSLYSRNSLAERKICESNNFVLRINTLPQQDTQIYASFIFC